MKAAVYSSTSTEKRSLLSAFLVMLFCALCSANLYAQDQEAYVETDAPDYAPGSTVIIAGEYWTAGETVYLKVTHLSPLPVPDVAGVTPNPYDVWTVIADANGEVHTTWYVNEFETGAQLQLEAYTDSGYDYRTFFTDGTPKYISYPSGTISVTGAGNVCLNSTPTLHASWTNSQCTQTGNGTTNLDIVIKWYKVGEATALKTENKKSDTNSSDYNPPTSNVGSFQYYVVVSWSSYDCVTGGSITSSNYTITVIQPTIYNVGYTGSLCSPPVSITLDGSQSGVNYQLIKNHSNVGSPVPGTGSSLVIASSVNENGTYTVVATDATNGCTADMNGSVDVGSGSVPTTYNIAPAGSHCYSTTGVTIGLDNSQNNVTYQLYRGSTAVGSSVTGNNNNPVSFGVQIDPGVYTVVATSNSGCTATMTGSVTINSLPTISLASTATSVCYSAGAQTTSVTYSATTNSPTKYSITWNASPANSFVAVTDATLPTSPITINIPAGTPAGTYTGYLTVKNANDCVSSSNMFTVTVNALPTANITGVAAVCAGSSSTLNSNATAGSGTISSYQWKLNGNSITEGTTATLDASTAGDYTVTVTNSNGCSATSTAFTLTVNALPTAVLSGDATLCAGDSTALSVALTGAQPWSITYTDGTTPVTISGITSTPKTIYVKPASSKTYSLTGVSDVNCMGISFTGTATVTVKTLSVTPTETTPASMSICPGDSATIGVVGGSLGTGAQWKWYAGSCGGTPAGTGASIEVSPATTTTYYVRAEGDCNTTECVNLVVTVKKPTVITTQPKDSTLVYGCNAPVLRVSATGEGILKYQWYKGTSADKTEGTKIWGATSNTYQTPFNYSVKKYYYYVIVTGGCGSATSNVATVNIVPQTASAVGDLYYTGPSMAYTANSTSNTATVTLSATIKNSEPCGDVRTALITFAFKNGDGSFTPIPSAQNLPVGFIDPNNPAMGGTASAIVQLNIASNASSDVFDIWVFVSGNYAGNPVYSGGDVTVMRPAAGGVIAGGAWLTNAASTGYIKGFLSSLNFNVEFAMKAKAAVNPKGKVRAYIWSMNKPDGTKDLFPHAYYVQSNAIASLNVVGATTTAPATATFTSKCTVSEIKWDGSMAAIEGNCQMVLDLSDVVTGLTLNKQDLVGLTIQRNSGGIWYSNNWINTNTVKAPIFWGNVNINPGSSTLAKAKEINIAESSLTSNILNIFPNPFSNRLYFNLQAPEDTHALLEMFDLTGRRLATVFDQQVTANQRYDFNYTPGNNVAPGMLIYRFTIGEKVYIGKVIYQPR